MSLGPSTAYCVFYFARPIPTLILALLFFSVYPSLTVNPQVVVPPIKWSKQFGVERYRLQIARDEDFIDVVFDGAINDNKYTPANLSTGRYYWRVAPADGEIRRFSRVIPFEIRAQREKTISSDGWVTASGEVFRPLALDLGRGADQDFVVVNHEGNVYALDAKRGTAIWTARFHSDAPADRLPARNYSQFVPVVIHTDRYAASLVVSCQNGVKAIDGLTGREIWITHFSGRPFAGTAAGQNVALIDDESNLLLVLDASTGKIKGQTSLHDKPIATPIFLGNEGGQRLLVPLAKGVVKVFSETGETSHSLLLDSEITTDPIVAKTSRGLLMLIGTNAGVAAFRVSDLEPLGKIGLPDQDQPTGSLAIADLDGDGLSEVVVLTTRRRVVVINPGSGATIWFSEIETAARAVAFADLDADGLPDLVLPGIDSFAIGLSGKDGLMIWKTHDSRETDSAMSSTSRERALAVSTLSDGRVIIAGDNPVGMGFKAVELVPVNGSTHKGG